MSDETKRGRRPKFEEAATLISSSTPFADNLPRAGQPGQPHTPPHVPGGQGMPRPPRVATPAAPVGTETIELLEGDAEIIDTPMVDHPTNSAVMVPARAYTAQPPAYPAPYEQAPLQLQAPSPFIQRPVGGVTPDRTLALVHAPDSTAAAQWRLLKFKLKENGDPRMIAITSPSQGEGKTVAAANLALCLAEGQRARVVLLEANLRTPALASLFGVEVPLGLTDQLRRRRRDPATMWELYELASNFFFLPCGRPAENPAAMLASEQFTALVRDLRLYYDFVVIDAPGALVAADMNIVQDLVEGVVIVCRSGVSTRPQLKKALERLASHNLVGLVLVDMS